MKVWSSFVVAAAAAIALACSASAIKVGDSIPESLEFHHGFPPEAVNLANYVEDKTVIIVPGYLEHQDALKQAGVDKVIVYCVNDGAVMQAWSDDQKIPDDGLLVFMADPYSIVTRALEMELTHAGPQSVGLLNRCKRFALVVQNGVVKAVQVAEGPGDPAGDDFPDATCAPKMLSIVQDLKKQDGSDSDEL